MFALILLAAVTLGVTAVVMVVRAYLRADYQAGRARNRVVLKVFAEGLIALALVGGWLLILLNAGTGVHSVPAQNAGLATVESTVAQHVNNNGAHSGVVNIVTEKGDVLPVSEGQKFAPGESVQYLCGTVVDWQAQQVSKCVWLEDNVLLAHPEDITTSQGWLMAAVLLVIAGAGFRALYIVGRRWSVPARL